jgi:fatty-acyl-CoA synthase
MNPTPATVAAMVRARAADSRPGLVTDAGVWSWAEHTAEAAARAGYAADRARRGAAGPPHVGVLLENLPAFSFWLAAAALGRFVIVCLNRTRRGTALADEVRSTACDLILTDSAGRESLDGLDIGQARLVDVDEQRFPPAPLPAEDGATAADLYLLIFTSGTSGTPKAVRSSQGKIAASGLGVAARTELTAEDVSYLSMPLFHSNAIIAGWTPSLAAGATMALRRRFSASGFLADVRRVGATYANYVGTPLSYVLAQPERSDDVDNPLRRVFGNEGAPEDLEKFAIRFNVTVLDSFGSTEGGLSVRRTPETPPGSLGRAGGDVRVVDPATGRRCPVARFDATGLLVNADVAVGELVNFDGAGFFEGYWNSPEENARRLRDGHYWSGDLGYEDAAGFLYFAGRSPDRLRVGGENFPAAPLARVAARHPTVREAVVYGVPDPVAGDRVMAAIVPGDDFDPATFARWMAAQLDISPAWVPRYMRVSPELPRTATGKILVRELSRQRWEAPGEVWCRDGAELTMRPFTDEDAAALRRAFAVSGRPLP